MPMIEEGHNYKGPALDPAPINETMEVFNKLEELTEAVRDLTNRLMGAAPPTPMGVSKEDEPLGIFGHLSMRNRQVMREINNAMNDIQRINSRL